MIISASYRTDIPAFYGRWFTNRLAAGWVDVSNPYGGKPARISLLPRDVDGFVFWTRNLEPFQEALQAVGAARLPFVVQFTATGYPRAIERSTIAPERAIAQMRAVRAEWGTRAVVWRYDPILFCSLLPAEWHEANFTGLARALDGVCDEVVVSVVQPYRKTVRTMAASARAHGFSWRDPPVDEKRALIARLADVAAGHGMALTLCSQPGLAGIPGTGPAVCVDISRLGDVAGRVIKARRKGNREGCACFESRDIGAYDTCAQGCAYCYAVSAADIAKAHVLGHDPENAFL